MRHLQPSDLGDLCLDHVPPCVSIYSPGHPGGAEEDATHWRNLVRAADGLLAGQGASAADRARLMRPATNILKSIGVWRDPGLGLACFSSPAFSLALRLPATPAPLVAVGGRFRVMPLLGMVGRCERFHLLAYSSNGARLLRCESGRARQIDMPGAPAGREEAVPAHDRDDALSFHTVAPGSIAGAGVMYHGHGVGIDDAKDLTLRYCQKIDEAVMAALESDGTPLVLASVASLWPVYREASAHPAIAPGGIAGNPDRMCDNHLMEKAIALLQGQGNAPRDEAVEQAHALAGTKRAESDLNRLVSAADAGSVETLLVREGWPENREGLAMDALEVADRVVSTTIRHRGRAFLVPGAMIPGGNPLFAIFRMETNHD